MIYGHQPWCNRLCTIDGKHYLRPEGRCSCAAGETRPLHPDLVNAAMRVNSALRELCERFTGDEIGTAVYRLFKKDPSAWTSFADNLTLLAECMEAATDEQNP